MSSPGSTNPLAGRRRTFRPIFDITNLPHQISNGFLTLKWQLQCIIGVGCLKRCGVTLSFRPGLTGRSVPLDPNPLFSSSQKIQPRTFTTLFSISDKVCIWAGEWHNTFYMELSCITNFFKCGKIAASTKFRQISGSRFGDVGSYSRNWPRIC